jgi:NitT/TauT family transport system substrate-binding protein
MSRKYRLFANEFAPTSLADPRHIDIQYCYLNKNTYTYIVYRKAEFNLTHPEPIMPKTIPRFSRLTTALGLTTSLLTGTLAMPSAAQAEGQLRIAEQFGIVYLLLNVVRDQQLIEKHGKQDGVEIKVDWTQLSGGSAVNDALLAGSVDIAGAGVGPLLTIWDRTHGKQNVKAVASLGNFPYYLVSNNPKVKTIADFTEKDRIAVPAVGVSVQSRYLQYASAKLWGDADYARLDKYTVNLPHPDAAGSIIAGGTELTGHFSNPPFQEQEIQAPGVHVVLNTYDLLGPNSPTVLFATEKFRTDNPKTYHAFIEALAEAEDFIRKDKGAAADTYIRVTKAKIDRAALLKIIDNPQFDFTITPKNTYPLAEFMYRVGAIKNKPASWQDYFFKDVKPLQGS